MVPLLAIDPIWYAVGGYVAAAIVIAIVLSRYFRK
jgi:hypothetical protein